MASQKPTQSAPNQAAILVVSVATDGKRMNGRFGTGERGKVPSVRKAEGQRERQKDHILESTKVLTGICLLPPSLSHLFWRNVNVPVFPGDWLAGSLFGIL